ncbi:Response regulator receiver domain-containing protein [Vibrio crassostreae]|nr:Response regulator receiver domain-containing protein [Vibrio crassostreae]CAK1991409.1 Response regulator receiver domain-containing protein [Vibrio crassostreae]CAK1996387.1 Response regulator receiver domain-containing protein [Vibrio crassostreae]CAK2004344.1 Response regulator receiver domain-containing protein [Vibrio crassostreae]CAK2024389.1 Response regulator receiver domain-containing protein [Vibrio crassostreae]
MKILVIDDKAKDVDHIRTKLLKIAEKLEGIHLDIIEPKEADLKCKLEKISEYSLIIVDYKFDTDISPIFKTGASLYSLLRDHSKDVPIYLISVLSFNTNQFGEFDLFINNEFIKDHSSFRKEIEDHRKLKSCDTIEKFKNLLGVPEELEDDFNIILKQFFNNRNDNSQDSFEISTTASKNNLNIRLFGWMVQSLLKKEGPLISRDGVALKLGISRNFFNGIESKFELAKYSGGFNQSLEERWWDNLIEDCILEFDDKDNLLSELSFKEASATLLGAANNADFSTCVVCDERFPDALGIDIDDDRKQLLPVHISCSEFNESIKQEPFFKNPRQIEGD